MTPFRRKKTKKQFPVKVITFESQLEFNLENRATGGYLFDLVCKTIGLRETWYFGLQHEDSKGAAAWLKMDKKVVDQNVKQCPTNSGYVFMFFAKYYPQDVNVELIQEITQHLFFLQIKQAILSAHIYCPPEASVLLASYAVQAKHGDYDPATYAPGMLSSENLLPQRVIDQYELTLDMWEDRIKTWYADHRGLSRDEAEMEYLKITEDLDMYGVNYFPITNKKKTELWLGVTAAGLNIYEKSNKLIPRTIFQWSEIKHISFDDKKFIIKPVESKSPNVEFYSQKHINKVILDLCDGNHDLFMTRHKPDTMEIQQMKAQAKEEKQRREIERNKLLRETQLREAAEQEKLMLEKKLLQMQEEMMTASESLKQTEETAKMYAEKSRVKEEEVKLTQQLAQTFQQEMERLRETAKETEKEKEDLERKMRYAEVYVMSLSEEKEKRAIEADELKKELICAKAAEREAKQELVNFLSRSIAQCSIDTMIRNSCSTLTAESPLLDVHIEYDAYELDDELPQQDDDEDEDDDGPNMEQLSREIERERVKYIEKSKQVQTQLKDLRSEIELLKKDDQLCHFDIISAEQVRLGETKYSTLKKVKEGSTKARVAFFEEL